MVEGKGTASRGELNNSAQKNNRKQPLEMFPSNNFSSFQGAMHILRKTSTGILLQNCLRGKATSRIGCQKVGNVPFMSLKKTARTGPVALH